MTVKVSGLLLRFTDFCSTVKVEAGTVGAALDQLVERYPDVGDVMFDQGEMRSTYRLFLNGEMLGVDSVDQPLRQDDRLEIVTPISGG